MYAAALLIAAAAAAAIGYLLLVLPTQWLKVEKIRHPLGLGIRILQISDLHIERMRIKPRRLSAIIAREKPDYIFLTGDFTKEEKLLSRLDPYLRMLAGHRIPVYAVLGNHDYQQRKVIRLIKLIQYYGIILLRNESVRMPGFELIGIDDYSTGKSNLRKSFQYADTDLPRIIITHDPNVVLAIKEPYDYLMAGHLHGKQLNLPFFYTFRPMGKLPAMGIYKGLHSNNYGTFYISKGIGQTAFNLRFLVRSEVTLHYL
ncbi:phosphodiesterase YaeI [Paenibacillus konkukensis]|uniref:Phosphodiesterase YaeI n=1 Tax=Paenibacillus konkukensis TaxID=2020716 RepID=A0ABY4RT69_9BACL|nr:phosphodiesterase YaeI [Paenibacillus konkukensis]